MIVSTASKVSLGQRLDSLNGIGPGFDHLRVGLSLAILTWHSFSLSYGFDYAAKLPAFPVPVLLSALLPMFFGLSGFLVMGSAIRTAKLKTFVIFRVLRILPALFTEIMISALILGPLLTVLPLREYFTDPMFVEYFGSLIGRVRFSLPGLFLGNPQPEMVNFALWTVGPEILCYTLLAAAMLTGVYRRSRTMLLLTLAYVSVSIIFDVIFGEQGFGEVLPGKLLIYAFLTGNLFYLYRDRVPFSATLAVLGTAASMLLIYTGQQTGIALFSYLSVPGFVYVICFIGLSRLPRLPFFHRGDYSYGIYIYGFPIQQSVAHFLPQYREWYVNLAISLPLTLLFAVGSWHLIEKPVLALRKRFATDAPARDSQTTGSRSWNYRPALAGTLIYALFVVDAANVFPVRPTVKALLNVAGLYEYKANDVRPFT